MAGGVIPVGPPGGSDPSSYKGGLTVFVLFTSIIAASGGLLFGYDNGVTGGVTAMPSFLSKFFPSVLRAEEAGVGANSAYCKYDNQMLQLFTSSLFIAGLFGSIPAAFTTRHWGRRASMLIAAVAYCIGVGLVTGAVNLVMLVIGRVLLGVGVGFANQCVTLYNSEMAPAHLRGALNILFQLAVTIGILAAQLINYGTQHINKWGWRLSLGAAIVPSVILLFGGIFLPDTPNSLIERGKYEEGRRVLQRIRGVEDVNAEYDDIKYAVDTVQRTEEKWTTIFTRKYRPQLAICTLMPLFQQFTGINAIIFYAPQLFSSLGSGQDSALLSTIIIGAVNVVSTLVAVFLVDRVGRKPLLIEAGIQMFCAEVAIAIILGLKFKTALLPDNFAIAVIVLVCVFVSCFAWSWGPLAWLIPSEICPLEVRSVGQSLNVATNFLFTFIIGQFFLSMLCSMQWGIFLFFAAFVVIMTLFAIFFIPETKNCPIETTMLKLEEHWYWRRFQKFPVAPSVPMENTQYTRDRTTAEV